MAEELLALSREWLASAGEIGRFTGHIRGGAAPLGRPGGANERALTANIS
jgi:hypothetical protein